MPLLPDAIMAHVKTHHASFWFRHGLTAKLLSEHLKIQVSPSQCTRTLKGNAPASVREKLRDPGVLSALEKAIGIEGVFACKSLHEVDDLVAASSGEPTARSRDSGSAVQKLSAETIDPAVFECCTNELSAIKSLVSSVQSGTAGRGSPSDHNLLIWPSEVVTGRSFLAYAAAATLVHKGISRAFVIHPFPRPTSFAVPQLDNSKRKKAFEESLLELGASLNVKPVSRMVPEILRALTRTKSVLFVLNADALLESSKSYNGMADLLREAARQQRTEGHCPVVAIVEAGRNPTYRGNVRVTYAPHERLAIRLIDRFSFFQKQWRRFSALRGHDVADDVGARLKRGRWYYNEWVKNSEIFPANIRLRAFFASNQHMQSYFDPTAGWDRLAGMEIEQLPEDIRLHLEDILYQLAELPREGRQPKLRAARWCSTAVYWLTEQAAEDLGRDPPKSKIETFHLAVKGLPTIVRQFTPPPLFPEETWTAPESASRPVYRSGLALKAAIQQDWRQNEPLERAMAHYRIATRLYEMQDDKDLLNVEFPLEPHWGRSRFHFLAECLRHLVRSCEHVSKTSAARHPTEARRTKFPEPPTLELKGCQPTEVINYCFWELFCRQLNGNSGTGNILNRNLALRHGAYQLTLELLQLMSEGNRPGEPHWALHPDHWPLYFREVAYAQLDLGDLAGAKQNFIKLIEVGREGNQVLDLVVYQLDLVLALTTKDDLDGALSALSEAEETLLAHGGTVKARDESLRLVTDPVERRERERLLDAERAQINRLERRIAARRVHILYLSGKHHDALAIYRTPDVFPDSSIVRELAHIKIATLGQLDPEAYLDEAMQVCISNIFQCTSKGVHHDALGFRIALGHLFRRKGMVPVAETMMDQVYNDILQYGCSERTYLAFLLEAGRTVLAQERYSRAYGGYLRPCADRAGSRGYARCARTARNKARIALEKIIEQRREYPGKESAWKERLRAELQARGDFAMKANLRLDPLFSFDLGAIEQWVQRLGSLENLQQEMDDLLDPVPASAWEDTRHSALNASP